MVGAGAKKPPGRGREAARRAEGREAPGAREVVDDVVVDDERAKFSERFNAVKLGDAIPAGVEHPQLLQRSERSEARDGVVLEGQPGKMGAGGDVLSRAEEAAAGRTGESSSSCRRLIVHLRRWSVRATLARDAALAVQDDSWAAVQRRLAGQGNRRHLSRGESIGGEV